MHAILHVFLQGVCHPDDGWSRRRGAAPRATLRRSTAAYRTSLAHIPTRKQQTHRCSLDVQPLSVGLPFQTLPVRAVLSSENVKRDARLLHKSLITEQHFFEIPEQILSSIRSSLCVQESPTSGGIALTKFEKHSTVYKVTIERPAYGCLTCVEDDVARPGHRCLVDDMRCDKQTPPARANGGKSTTLATLVAIPTRRTSEGTGGVMSRAGLRQHPSLARRVSVSASGGDVHWGQSIAPCPESGASLPRWSLMPRPKPRPGRSVPVTARNDAAEDMAQGVPGFPAGRRTRKTELRHNPFRRPTLPRAINQRGETETRWKLPMSANECHARRTSKKPD